MNENVYDVNDEMQFISLPPDALSLITLLSQNSPPFITLSQLSSHRALSPTELIPLTTKPLLQLANLSPFDIIKKIEG